VLELAQRLANRAAARRELLGDAILDQPVAVGVAPTTIASRNASSTRCRRGLDRRAARSAAAWPPIAVSVSESTELTPIGDIVDNSRMVDNPREAA